MKSLTKKSKTNTLNQYLYVTILMMGLVANGAAIGAATPVSTANANAASSSYAYSLTQKVAAAFTAVKNKLSRLC